MVFNLMYNFLNNTSNIKYAPFPFMRPIFEFDNKDSGKPEKEWVMKYSSFKFQLKKLVPFTIKFLGKHMQSQTMYNKTFAVTKSGEKLWSDSSLNAQTVTMPILKPETLKKSSIITKELWTTLFLAMPKLEMCKDFDIIYNSGSDGLSFNRLSTHIVGYKAPTIMLISHTEHNEETKEYTNHILGVYNDTEIKDKGKYSGDLNNCIFSISPDLKVMRTINNKGGTNYAYLNTVKIEKSQYPYGMGFGGSTVEFRMWIDGDNITESSYLLPSDNTYEVGYLLPIGNSGGQLNINKIEIYGLGGQDALEAQMEHREMLQKLKEKKGKVDKKALMEGDFNKEMLFGNTFSHRAEVAGRDAS
jgi:hypothetical protein